MVFDRKQSDVSESEKIILRGAPFTPEEMAILEKGTLTTKTINRITNQILLLKRWLESYGYYSQIEETDAIRKWENNFFTKQDFEQIVYATNSMRSHFFIITKGLPKPVAKYHYNEINLLEKALEEMTIMYRDVVSFSKECGNYECGG